MIYVSTMCAQNLSYTFDRFPEELKQQKLWVVWRLEDSDKRERCKMPRTIKGFGASSTNPDHWSTLRDALANPVLPIEKYQDTPYSAGVGCVCSNGYVGVDLDHCWDDQKIELDEFAKKFIASLPPTYTELTPSRSGLHLWYKLPDGHRPEKAGLRTKKAEVYFRDRYLTVTGWHAGNTPATIHQLTVEEVGRLAAAVEATREKKLETVTRETAPAMSSDKFQEYMTRSDFPDLSAVVHSLVVMLLRKHSLDAIKADAEFRESAIFKNTHWKDKWERLGKGEIESCTPMAREWLERDLKRKNKSENQITTGPDGFALTDTGNAIRMKEQHGVDLCYVPAMKSFYVWNGKFWDQEFAQAFVYERAKQTVTKLLQDAKECDSHDIQKATMKWAWESEGRSRMDNMMNMARNEVTQRRPADFDLLPQLLSFDNGVYDLNANEFREHRREDLCARSVGYDYDEHASSANWELFIERILPNKAILDFVQRSLGYALSGYDRHNYIWFLIGETGANGKSTFVETLQKVLGDYSRVLEFASLMQRESRGPSGDLARLQGARFVSGCESDEGQRLSASVIKRLTGGDTIQASFKFKDEFEFQPTHKIWLATNHPPQLPANDDGLWRRVIRIPFDVQIPENERDPELKEKLKRELPGIMNWIIRGWKEYQERKLNVGEVPELQESRSKYRDELDVVKHFLEERFDETTGGDIGMQPLYQEFKVWFMESHGRKSNPMSREAFSKRLRKHGFPETSHTKAGNVFKGVGSLIKTQQQFGGDRDERAPF